VAYDVRTESERSPAHADLSASPLTNVFTTEESMLDTLTFAELEAQEPELLPPRTVLSLISMNGNGKCNGPGNDCNKSLVSTGDIGILNNNTCNVNILGVICKA
jgi:hypothetical protein